MRPTVSALFYLWSRSLLNMGKVRIARLKQPKYLFGALFGGAYLVAIFVLPLLANGSREPANPESVPDLSLLATSAFSLSLLVIFMVLWLWRRERSALFFSEAEIAFLLPAPVAHRTLVHFTLIRSQMALLFSALIFALISARWQFTPAPFLNRFVGWWLVMGVFLLHMTASGSTLTRLRDRGFSKTACQLLMAALFLLVGSLVVASDGGQLHLPGARDLENPQAVQAWLQDVTGSGLLYWLLTPLRLLVQPFVTPDGGALLHTLPPALAVYGLHYLWALRSDVPNTEGAMAKAQKRASMQAALRSGTLRFGTQNLKGRRPPFRLGSSGSPAIAFLWKNLLSARGYLRLRTFFAIAAIMLAIDWWLTANTDFRFLYAAIVPITALFAFYTLLFGAHLARQDLRSDMSNIDVFKTYPLEGWQIVFGGLLAPAAILTGILWLCLLQLMLIPPPRGSSLSPQMWIMGGLSMALLLPLLCCIQLLVLNAAALLFPAWSKSVGTPGARGLDEMGQRILFLAAQWLVLLVTLVPAILIGVVAWLPLQLLLGTAAILPAAIVAAIVLAGEIAWGINWLGQRFDAFDLTE